MIRWGLKSKTGFLVDVNDNKYGTLLDAKLFKLKKEAKNYLEAFETLVKIEIKEIK